MPRSMARQAALALVYESISGGDADDESLEMILQEYNQQDTEKKAEQETGEESETPRLRRSERAYVDGLFQGVMGERELLEEKISGMLTAGWTLERLSRIDLCILLLALRELESGDAPDNVVISEALRLADTFSEPKSKGFINALLGRAVRQKQAAENP